MTRFKKLINSAITLVLAGLIAAPLYAQLPEHLRDYPLASFRDSGDLVAPFFDGWIKNPDGSVTMVFGFMNRNRKEIVDVPLGPNNYIEPAQFDGVQPTHFPVREKTRVFIGIRERGAFAVTVPADMAGTEIVWTLNHAGHSYSVPGRATSTAYEMSDAPRSLGSLNPAIRFDLDGPESINREGIYGQQITASVGKPVSLTAYVQDRGEREQYDVSQTIPLGTEWILHQGPAIPEFDSKHITGKQRGEDNEGTTNDGWTVVTTQATFWEPGDYVIRLRADNFEAVDSEFDEHCCWSNAYLPVTVTP